MPVANQKKVPVKHNNCPWQISKSKSFTGNLAIFGQNSHEMYPFARGKFQKSAREAQQLPVANQEIKKFHGQKKVSRGKKKTLVYNTQTSQVVTHPSTTQIRRCLTLEIRRDPVISPWYGRRHEGNLSRAVISFTFNYKKKLKVYNTRISQVVTHPNTTQARRCLTLKIRRDPVISPWYGRRHK